MLRFLAIWAGLLACGPAVAADYTPRETYDIGIQRAQGALYAGGAGVAVGGMSAGLVMAFGGCGERPARTQGVCEGPWLADGLALAGVVVGEVGSAALAASTLRARRGLKRAGVLVTPAPGLVAWVLFVGAAASTVPWIGLAQPAEALPLMPAVRDQRFLALSVGLTAGAYGFGIAQYAIVKRAGHRLPEPDEGAAALRVVPFAGPDRVGVALRGAW